MNYTQYINGNDWLEKSARYLQEYPVCELCHKFPSTQVHHTSYKRMGEEKRKDLMGVCDRCHKHLHLLPPNISDPELLKKANKLIKDFIKYPALKTLALNELMALHYPGQNYMVDIAEAACDETAFFMQNVMEILAADSITKGVDLIEELTRIVFVRKLQATKTSKAIEKDKLARKAKYDAGEYDYLFEEKEEVIPVESTLDEILEGRRRDFCLNQLASKPILGEAMRWANNEFYEGKMFFKRSGIDTPAKFYLTLLNKDKKIIDALFNHLGGKVTDLIGKI